MGDWSPDGQALAFVRMNDVEGGGLTTTIGLADADGNNERPLIENSPWALSSLRWSRDGRRIALMRRSQINATGSAILMLDPRTGATETVMEIDGALSELAWAGDEELIYARFDGVLAGFTGRPALIVRHDLADDEKHSLVWGENMFAGVGYGWPTVDVLGRGQIVYSTTVVEPGWRGRVDGAAALVLSHHAIDREEAGAANAEPRRRRPARSSWSCSPTVSEASSGRWARPCGAPRCR